MTKQVKRRKLFEKLKRWWCKHPSLEQRYRTTYHTEEQKSMTLPMVNCIKYCLVCGKDLHITTAFDWGHDVSVQKD